MAHVIVAKNDADRCGDIFMMFSKKTGIYTIVLKNVNVGEENVEANKCFSSTFGIRVTSEFF